MKTALINLAMALGSVLAIAGLIIFVTWGKN